MVYNIKKSNGEPLVSIPDGTMDTSSTSLVLPGRNSVNFGISIDQNFVNILQNFANASPPPKPQVGQLWYNTVRMELNVYDGAKWISITTSFDGSGGMTTTSIGPNNIDVSIVISQYQIITVISGGRVEPADCPDSIVFNDVSYAFSSRFLEGIYPGINLANDPAGEIEYWINGNATSANVLAQAKTVYLNGVASGQFQFDGGSNVNVVVSDSNVYITNSAGFITTTTVAGTWTKVLVSDGGRILSGNNITSSDVVAALGYTPFDGSNINVNAIGNTVIGRDGNASFAANVIVANRIVVNGIETAEQVSASEFIGTASNARVLTSSRKIFLSGDTYGNVAFDGSTDVIIDTSLISSGVTAGTYNLVNVDNKGRVTNGRFESSLPLGAIMLFPDTFVPSGWGVCDGTNYTATNGTVYSTPNLIAESSRVNEVAGTGWNMKYLIHYDDVPSAPLPPGIPGAGPTIVIDSTSTAGVPILAPTSTILSGGPSILNLQGGYGNIEIATVGISAFNPGEGFTETTFQNTLYFNALAYIMGIGDNNGIMFSSTDAWKNLASLTVQDVRDNLTTRARANLPAFVGKYMISLKSLTQQVLNLGIPTNQAFSSLLQDQLISSMTSNFAHQLAIAAISPTDNNLFCCHYLGSAEAFIAVIRSQNSDIVSDTLHRAGYYTTATSGLERYTKTSFLQTMANIMQIAKAEVSYRAQVNQNVITSGQFVSSSSTNVIVTSSAVNGYKIGNDDYVDLGGGYFPSYDDVAEFGAAAVGPGISAGSAGTITVSLSDAGACALAGVLQTENIYDQAGLAQLCVNRTGANITDAASYSGNDCFSNATANGAFSALSAAIYGPNDNEEASQTYGDLFVDLDLLRQVLSNTDPVDMQIELAQLFNGKLTQDQLDRVSVLRDQVYNNGPQITAAQAAIGSAVNFVAPNSISGPVKYPFGEDASGYLTLSSISGFFAPNSASAAGSAPAPSPETLLDRARSKVIPRVVEVPPVIEESKETHWGDTRRISWVRNQNNVNAAGGIGFTLSTNVKTVYPAIKTGDKFSMVVGSSGSWINKEAEVYEFYYTYGTPVNNPVVKLLNFRKACWLVCWYDGNDNFNCYTYYAGDDTDRPFNTTYHLSYRFWGSDGEPSGTVVNRNTSVAAYVAAYPLNV
jgi:hypothetical protein